MAVLQLLITAVAFAHISCSNWPASLCEDSGSEGVNGSMSTCFNQKASLLIVLRDHNLSMA